MQTVSLHLDTKTAARLHKCSSNRNITPEQYALACLKDWLGVEDAGNSNRAQLYRGELKIENLDDNSPVSTDHLDDTELNIVKLVPGGGNLR